MCKLSLTLMNYIVAYSPGARLKTLRQKTERPDTQQNFKIT